MRYFIVVTLFLLSCSGAEPHNDHMNLESTDSLVGFEINENRITAVELNNELSSMQTGVLDLVDLLFQSDSSSIDMNLENALFEVNLNLSRLEELRKDEPTAEAFISNMIALMQFYKEEFTGKFRENVPLLKKNELSTAESAQLEAYDLMFVEKEKNAFEEVFIAQEQFAKTNNIYLEDQ